MSKSNRRSSSTGSGGRRPDPRSTAPSPAPRPQETTDAPAVDEVVVDASAAPGAPTAPAVVSSGSGSRVGSAGTSGARAAAAGRHTSASGSRRAGRRETARRRYDQPSFLERHRGTVIGGVAVLAVALVSVWIFVSATSPTFACSTTFEPSPAASGQLGVTEPDMGNNHVGAGTKVTYTYCPPASGPHINAVRLGPIEANFYGPNDRAQPQGWIHNLEHGALVVLYSCEQGGCDEATLSQLRKFVTDFPPSELCKTPPRTVGPVVARFDQMPHKFAGLVWDRVLYQDTLDTAQLIDFYDTEGEKLTADKTAFINPPEVLAGSSCANYLDSIQPTPSPSVSASPSTSPSAAPSASTSPSAAPSASAPASAGASPSASPSASASPSPSAS